MFEEEEEVGGDSSLGSSNSRSRGQTFRKKVPKTSLLHHLLEEEQEDQQTFGSPAFYANDTDRGGGDSGSGSGQNRERPILSIFKMLNGNRSGLSVKDVFHAQRDLNVGGGSRDQPFTGDGSVGSAAGEVEKDDEEEVEEDSLHPDPRFRFRPPEDRLQPMVPNKVRIPAAVTSGPIRLLYTTTSPTTTTTTSTLRTIRTTARTTTTSTPPTTTKTTTTTATTASLWPQLRTTTPVPPYVPPYDRYNWEGGQHRGLYPTHVVEQPAGYMDPVYDMVDTAAGNSHVRPLDVHRGDSAAIPPDADYDEDSDAEQGRHYPRDHFFPMSIEPSQHGKEAIVR